MHLWLLCSLCVLFFIIVFLRVANRQIYDLTVPVLLALLFFYYLILMAVILVSEIKSEPLDQSDGSDYTRNCEPWYSVFLVLFLFLLLVFFTTFLLSLHHFFYHLCIMFLLKFSSHLPLKIIKNIFYFLLLVFYFSLFI